MLDHDDNTRCCTFVRLLDWCFVASGYEFFFSFCSLAPCMEVCHYDKHVATPYFLHELSRLCLCVYFYSLLFFFFFAWLGFFLILFDFPDWEAHGQEKDRCPSFVHRPTSYFLLATSFSVPPCQLQHQVLGAFFACFMSRVYALSGGSGHGNFYLYGKRVASRPTVKRRKKKMQHALYFSRFFFLFLYFIGPFFCHPLLRRWQTVFFLRLFFFFPLPPPLFALCW
jgi:hypothetical protein